MDHLETEGRNPASERLDELSALELARLINAEDTRVAEAVGSQLEVIARAIDVIADRLRAGGRLVYVGAGTSGRLGVLDASECPPTFNSPPEHVVGLIAGGPQALTRAVEGAEDHPEYAEADLEKLQFGQKDVLVGIATSGRTPYVLGAAAYARRLGAYTIGLACTSAAELKDVVDLAIVPVVGPEVLSGSTRLKAGTATKLVLNMLTTGAMVRMGKTFGNLMVDLRATNVKLKARTNRIVRQLTGIDHARADEVLQRCGGELKTALVAQMAGLSPEEARRRLAEASGQVRRALPARPTASADHSLVLGIDGGGTHTVALLARDGVLIGRGEGGPSNRQAVGDTKAQQAIDSAIGNAFQAANLARCPVGRACLGLAGAGRAEDRARVQEWATREQVADAVEVVTDAALLFAAGTSEGWGLAMIAGTGSIVWGRTRDGREARGGGWGYVLGDEGSGYAIAREALRAVVRAADGAGKETALAAYVLERLQIRDVRELVPLVYSGALDRPTLAALAPGVIELASRDEVARELIDSQAAEFARTALAVSNMLGFHDERFPVAVAGGLLVSCDAYRDRVFDSLGRCAKPGAVTVVREPAEGAVQLALRAC